MKKGIRLLLFGMGILAVSGIHLIPIEVLPNAYADQSGMCYFTLACFDDGSHTAYRSFQSSCFANGGRSFYGDDGRCY